MPVQATGLRVRTANASVSLDYTAQDNAAVTVGLQRVHLRRRFDDQTFILPTTPPPGFMVGRAIPGEALTDVEQDPDN